MSIVQIKDKRFKTFISEDEIQQRVKAVADRINHDMEGKKPLRFYNKCSEDLCRHFLLQC